MVWWYAGRMRDLLLILFALLTVTALATLGYVAASNRRKIRLIREREQRLARAEQRMNEVGRELGQTRQELAAYIAALSVVVDEDREELRHPRRERWLKAVPPLGALVALLAWLQRRSRQVIPAASLAAATGVLGLIVTGTLPVTIDDGGTQLAQPPPPSMSVPGRPTSLPPEGSTFTPLPSSASGSGTTLGSTSAAGSNTTEPAAENRSARAGEAGSHLSSTRAHGRQSGDESTAPPPVRTTTAHPPVQTTTVRPPTQTTTVAPPQTTRPGTTCRLNVTVDPIIRLCLLKG